MILFDDVANSPQWTITFDVGLLFGKIPKIYTNGTLRIFLGDKLADLSDCQYKHNFEMSTNLYLSNVCKLIIVIDKKGTSS